MEGRAGRPAFSFGAPNQGFMGAVGAERVEGLADLLLSCGFGSGSAASLCG